MKIKNIETALKIFEDAAITYSEASKKGDYKIANKNYDKVVVAAEFLKQQGAIQLVSRFLDHASPGVRNGAAAYLLPMQEQDAVRVLEAIANGPRGVHRLEAEMILSEWRKGNLKL